MHLFKKRKVRFHVKSNKMYWRVSPQKIDTGDQSENGYYADINESNESNESNIYSSELEEPEPSEVEHKSKFNYNFFVIFYLTFTTFLVYNVLTLDSETRQDFFSKYIKYNMNLCEVMYNQYMLQLSVIWYNIKSTYP